MILKFAGVFAIAFVTLAASYILWRYPRQKHWSLSMHVGDRPETIRLFAAVSIVSNILLYMCLTFWLAPALQLNPVLFQALLVPGILCQFVAALVPYTSGRSAIIHDIFSYSMAFFMMFLVACMLTSPVLTAAARIVASATLVYMILGASLLRFIAHMRRNYLAYQMAYVASFYAVVLVVIAGV